MPPSAISGTPRAGTPRRTSTIAENCGTPTPATTRVVQIEPGPMPTLTASAPASISASGAVGGGDVAGDRPAPQLLRLLMPATASTTPARVAVRGVDDDDVDLRVEQRLRPLEPLRADAGRRADAQPSVLVLAGVGEALGLLDVLHRDQPDAAVVLVHHQQLLDPVLVQQSLRVVTADPVAHGDQRLVRLSRVISSWTGWRGSMAKRTSRLVRMPSSRPVPRSTTGTPENLCAFIRRSASASVASGPIVIGSTTIPDSYFFTRRTSAAWFSGRHVLVDDAEAARLRHGDGEPALGDRVHRRRNQRDAEQHVAGEARSQVGVGGQHAGGGGHQQHVVEGQSFGDAHADSARGMARHHTRKAGPCQAPLPDVTRRKRLPFANPPPPALRDGRT